VAKINREKLMESVNQMKMRRGLRDIIEKFRVRSEMQEGGVKMSKLSREIRNTPLIKLK